MARLKSMEEIKQILRHYEVKKGIKTVARILGCSKNTVRNVIRSVEDFGLQIDQALALSNDELSQIVYSKHSSTEHALFLDFQERLSYFLTELKRPGVTRQLLWEEYQKEVKNGYKYSQFCTHLRRYIGSKNLTMPMRHQAGTSLQLDFAGKKMFYIDVQTGEQISCEVLVGILPFSGFTFVIALPSQRIEDFVYGITKNFEYLAGVPKSILSDNLKSYVSKPDRYEPTFTDLCNQLGNHYGVDLDAARVRKPKDKGAVENAVKIAYTRVYAPLRNKVFFSIDELNEAILDQLEIHNSKPFQKKEGSRKEVFEALEKQVLAPLPSEHFEIKHTKRAKVQKNYHIVLAQDKCYYSVHHTYVGKQAIVIYTRSTVEIHIDNQRVATHKRLKNAFYDYVTIDSHMPKAHQKYGEVRGYTASYFKNEAAKIGEFTTWAMEKVLRSRRHLEQSYKSCLGILHLAKKYTPERLEVASKICVGQGYVSYTRLKKILAQNLDLNPPKDTLLNIPEHENIRGEDAYQ